VAAKKTTKAAKVCTNLTIVELKQKTDEFFTFAALFEFQQKRISAFRASFTAKYSQEKRRIAIKYLNIKYEIGAAGTFLLDFLLS